MFARVSLFPYHGTHCRAVGRAEGWDDEERDGDGNSIRYEDLEYVFVGDDFKGDSEDIRWVAMAYDFFVRHQNLCITVCCLYSWVGGPYVQSGMQPQLCRTVRP